VGAPLGYFMSKNTNPLTKLYHQMYQPYGAGQEADIGY
jgi:hypothetical protein